jgi:hypothetical protein
VKDKRGYTQSHANRIKKTREAASPKPVGVGSQVPDSKLIEAAGHWLDQEKDSPSSNGKVSALAVGKSLGLSVAPEWLDSQSFRQILEVERFKRRVLEMKSRPETSSLISELIGLGLLEAQKRLVLESADIPATVLYGDILHKWPKMLREFEQGQAPVKAGDVFISIVKEINLIQDPNTREKLKRQILGEYERAALALSPPSVDATIVAETGRPDESDSSSSVPVGGSEPVVEPRPAVQSSNQYGQSVEVPVRNSPAQPGSRVPEEQLWSDPAALD